MSWVAALACFVTMAGQTAKIPNVVGFVCTTSGSVRLTRGATSTLLDERHWWMPLKLDDRIQVRGNDHVELSIGLSTQQGERRTLKLYRDQPLSEQFLGALVPDAELGDGQILGRLAGQLPKNAACLILPTSLRVVAYSDGVVPALHWLAGPEVKRVRLRLLNEQGATVWTSSWWPARDGAAKPAELFTKLRDCELASRRPRMQLVFDAENGHGSSHWIYIERTQDRKQDEADRLFVSELHSPWELANALSGKRGYAARQHFMEASDLLIRNQKLHPKSQAIVVMGLLYAQEEKVLGLHDYLEFYVDQKILDEWFSDPQVMAYLWRKSGVPQ
jgi:hypothetical protein